jgi:hypothetical protein
MAFSKLPGEGPRPPTKKFSYDAFSLMAADYGVALSHGLAHPPPTGVMVTTALVF